MMHMLYTYTGLDIQKHENKHFMLNLMKKSMKNFGVPAKYRNNHTQEDRQQGQRGGCAIS